MKNEQDITNHILSLADRCVKCGLCLPQCPTYALTENENESPRGRIALIQGWLTGQLKPSEKLMNHLDQCLLCRRCERVCPSAVPYGEIIDRAKNLLKENRSTSFYTGIKQLSLKTLMNKKFSSPLINGLRFLQKSGGLFLLRKSQLGKLLGLQPYLEILPELDKPFKPEHFYPAITTKQGEVALFTGCLSGSFDSKTVEASIRLLTRLGYDVHIPPQQGCCGALHMHDGNQKQAVNFANHNIQSFNPLKNIKTVISLVNACTSQLKEYPGLNTSDSFSTEVKDIIEFLSEVDWPENITMIPLNKTVALQIPCSLQNSLRAEEKLITLLQRIPGISLPPDAIYNKCCGAAGTYFVNFPETSDKLKLQALDKLTKSQPDLIISSNLGCALQLKAGLKQQNNKAEVIHPVLLLEQQLKLI
ncbi:MAG: (Fe-S)-binding protein [Gammaproteobacteria bacterium]|nr:(Fe-S)-binding protein [Gammaproteobacteria bacterium]